MATPVYTFPEYQENLDAFLEAYTVENFVWCPTQKMPKLKPKQQRVCRFCGRDATQTKFKHDAHLIPNLLGNRYLLSDSECDTCNLQFSLYENDLANFLGITRTVLGVKGKENVPTFQSYDKQVTAKSAEFLGITNGVKIERKSVDNDAFKIIYEQGRAEVVTLKQPYVPARVYKAFLKMALSAMPEAQMANYEQAVKILASDQYDERVSFLFMMVQHQLPSNHAIQRPHAFVFRKRDPASRRISHQFYLRYQNHVYVLPVPLSLEDINLGLYDEAQITTTISPPVLFSAPAGPAHCASKRKDLSSSEAVREEEVLVLEMDPGAMKTAQTVDRETGEVIDAPFDPTEIVGIYLAPAGSTLTFPQ